jgi:hypothetical protein
MHSLLIELFSLLGTGIQCPDQCSQVVIIIMTKFVTVAKASFPQIIIGFDIDIFSYNALAFVPSGFYDNHFDYRYCPFLFFSI